MQTLHSIAIVNLVQRLGERLQRHRRLEQQEVGLILVAIQNLHQAGQRVLAEEESDEHEQVHAETPAKQITQQQQQQQPEIICE
jgi:hypothetical protein